MAYKYNPLLGVGLDEVGAGGAAATPGGADTQVQFNDGGSFGGDSGLTYNDTAGALTVGGKTVTTDAPVINLSQTWNNAATTFTGFKLNVTDTASAADSKLLDLQVNGVSKFDLRDGALITSAFSYASTGAGTAVILSPNGGATYSARFSTSTLFTTGTLGLANNVFSSAPDVVLNRDAANILAQRNGTNAQAYRLYNTYTNASNYERGFLQWNSNVLEIGSEGAGTGSEQPVRITAATLKLPNLPTYADNTAATSGGLVAGDVYKTATGELRITV